MNIKIAERLKPYSHVPGTYFILPGSTYRLKCFPGCLLIDDLSDMVPKALASVVFDITGPVREFTVEQDLEKGLIRVWGMTATGFLRYCVKAIEGEEGIVILFEKTPEQGLRYTSEGKWKRSGSGVINARQKLMLSPQPLDESRLSTYLFPKIDRLSLGNHKSQDWELMRRRRDFAEIFPIWHRLGQLIPSCKVGQEAGVLSLLDECCQAMELKAPEKILSYFERVFLAGFDMALSPRLEDHDYQGLHIPSVLPSSKCSPMWLLSRGAELIRRLFIYHEDCRVHLLPFLPTEFHCGRFLDITCGEIGNFNLEWSKKFLRCCSFRPSQSMEISFAFSHGEKRFRLRKGNKDRGIICPVGKPLEVSLGQNYWFDNFER